MTKILSVDAQRIKDLETIAIGGVRTIYETAKAILIARVRANQPVDPEHVTECVRLSMDLTHRVREYTGGGDSQNDG